MRASAAGSRMYVAPTTEGVIFSPTTARVSAQRAVLVILVVIWAFVESKRQSSFVKQGEGDEGLLS